MFLNAPSNSLNNVARSVSSSPQAATTNCSVNNTCLNGGVNTTLVIVLGSCIPIFIACVVLYFIHRAHVKRLRREEKNDKDFDMDSGVGDLPPPIPTNNHLDKSALYPQNSSIPPMPHQDLQPPPNGLPYLVPKANMSRESLQSMSDPRDHPYAAIYSSAPPSPGGGATSFSANSDKMSISGRSTKNLLPPPSQADNGNGLFSSAVRPLQRVASPLAFAEPESSPHNRAHGSSSFDKSPNASPSPSAVQRRNTPEDSQSPFGQDDVPASSHQEILKHSTSNHPGSEFADSPPADFDIPLSTHSSRKDNYAEYEADKDGEIHGGPSPPESTSEPRSQFSSRFEPSNETIDSRSTDVSSYHNSAVGSSIEKPREFPTRTVEEEEDHAKRIQSVYQEYYGDDSQHYNGSEEWEPAPHRPAHDTQYQPPESLPLPRNGDLSDRFQQDYQQSEWNRGSQRSKWSQSPQRHDQADWSARVQPQYTTDERHQADYGQDYYRGRADYRAHQVYPEQPPPVAHYHPRSPSVRPAYYSRPSTSHSMSSHTSRPRTPTRNIPLEPLSYLPSTRDKLDDLSSPISYARPRRFMGAGGTASPIPRSASPANVLSSSYSQLSELPVPHRLRRSGSFSSIDFTPVRKYAGSEVDAGDTASIRSLARTEHSLMAVSGGAGRIDRLPQDLVPLGKSGALANLRPQNYNGNRYI